MSNRSPIAAAGLIVLAVALARAEAAPADRGDEPVVTTGAALAALRGKDPARIVGFRFGGGWTQVPVQIDERAVVDFGQIYDDAPSGFTVLTYTDPGTFTGADPDPAFDADDELALTAGSTGPRWNGGPAPAGTVAGTLVELRVRDPLDGAESWVYLFEGDGTLDPAAGATPIDYDFNLLSGDYKTTYETGTGFNPEDSSVTTGSYSVHFADRWIRDGTTVTEGNATGVDILDRHKNLFGPGVCSRTEETFSHGRGAFTVNRRGPVRALRGYVGANSGPTTHRIHRFYEQREEILTVLRVHPIPGVIDLFDYEPAAAGMTYRDDLNPGGVAIDGAPDVVALGPIVWQMVSGAQGTLAIALLLETDLPDPGYTSHYSDTTTPAETQCTGDAVEYAAGGPFKNDGILNTDPGAVGTVYRFELTRVIRYGPPDRALVFATTHYDRAANPLVVLLAPGAGCDDADGDGWATCGVGCTPPPGTVCGDCDDGDPSFRPGAHDLCDGLDNDCSGTADDAVCADFAVPAGDTTVDGLELSYIGRAFAECSANPTAEWWAPVDYTDDGCVDGSDLSVLGALFGCGGQTRACGP